MELNWFINEDHFEARTEIGTYKVGDWGGGKVSVRFPGGDSLIEKMSLQDGKDRAQRHYDERRAA